MTGLYDNFGVQNTPVGTPSIGYGSFGVVNSNLNGLSTLPNIVTQSISPRAFVGGVVSGDLKSANYLTGVSGWAIKADGSAEFQNVTGLTFTGISISGATIIGSTITGGTIRTAVSGQRVVLNSTGNEIDFYNSSNQAVGALYASGTDMVLFAGVSPAFNGYVFNQTSLSSNPSSSDLGSTSFPWNNVYALRYYTSNSVFISSGLGSPEGIVTASQGSLYLNISGGANTTLYVKESGTGNTGWVAK